MVKHAQFPRNKGEETLTEKRKLGGLSITNKKNSVGLCNPHQV